MWQRPLQYGLRELHEHSPPVGSASHRQKSWDVPQVSTIAQALLDSTSDATARACLLAASSKESGAWVSTLPISSLGLRMDDSTSELRLASVLVVTFVGRTLVVTVVQM